MTGTNRGTEVEVREHWQSIWFVRNDNCLRRSVSRLPRSICNRLLLVCPGMTCPSFPPCPSPFTKVSLVRPLTPLSTFIYKLIYESYEDDGLLTSDSADSARVEGNLGPYTRCSLEFRQGSSYP